MVKRKMDMLFVRGDGVILVRTFLNTPSIHSYIFIPSRSHHPRDNNSPPFTPIPKSNANIFFGNYSRSTYDRPFPESLRSRYLNEISDDFRERFESDRLPHFGRA